MKNEKLKKAEVLLDAVGEIDDEYLVGALSYKRRRGAGRRLLVVAAALAFSLTVLLCAAVGLRLADSLGAANSPENEGEVAHRDALDSFMAGLAEDEGFTYLSDESELPYTSGKAYIVWQYEGEDGYYLSGELSCAELESLTSLIGSGRQVGADSPTLECKMWVLLGDGRVVTPYLKANAGNISSRVFDYEAEITPTQRLADRISAILS